MTDASPTFASLLKESRLKRGLSQETLAERAGLTREAISLLERGARLTPRRDTVILLADALKLPPADRARLLAAVAPRATQPAVGIKSHSPSTLPTRLTSFIGRGSAVAEVGELVRVKRLVTLTGAGGIGKSSLAWAVTATLAGEFANGAWLVELAALGDEALIPQTVAAALGVREQGGEPVLSVLGTVVGTSHRLLILDNCEHLLGACARLAEALLLACPHLHVLVTSREPLRLGVEVVWRVPALMLPESDTQSVAEITKSEAVRLFVERAGAVRPGFAVTEGNADALAQICRRLDGIPLALELAAARASVLTIEQIAGRLDDRFRLLTTGSRTALPRHQTLRATIDWSYDLLTRRDQVLFRRLAVFAGGWTLEAAEVIVAGEEVTTEEVLDGLADLVAKSLVVVEEHVGKARYRFLETIRQYAGDRLVESEETAAARQHWAWFLELAEQSEPEFLETGDHPGLKQLATEHDNLRAALTWSLEHDPPSSLRLAGCLAEFWRRAGHHLEGRRWLAAVLAATKHLSPDHLARARVLLGAGSLAADAGEYGPRLVSEAEESVELFRKAGDQRGLVMALQHLGRCVLDAGGDAEQVRRLFLESLETAQSLRDTHGIGFAWANLAYLPWRQGNLAEARRQYEESVAYIRASGDAMFTALVLGILGWCTLVDGDAELARRYKEESLAILRGLEAKEAVGLALLGLAHVARAQGDGTHLRDLLSESAPLLRETGSPGLSDWLTFVGQLAVEQGEYVRGVRLLAAGESEGPRLGSLRLLLYEMPRDLLDLSLATARSAIGERAAEIAWAEGKALQPEQAIASAFAD
jgi:non-specific serine/threonine protein kinase